MELDPAKTTGRLGELRAPIAERLRAALAYTAGKTGERTAQTWKEEHALYAAAFEAAGLRPSTQKHFSRREIPLASTLTPEQRVVAEVVAHVSGIGMGMYGLPMSAWVRRQWLGLDPPGALFTAEVAGVPFFHAIRAAVLKSEQEARAVVASLSPDVRVCALADLELAKLDYFELHLSTLLHLAVDDVGEDLGAWAMAFADRLLEIFSPGVDASERGHAQKPSIEIRWLVFLALVRGGVPILPRWDQLLPLGLQARAKASRECIEAIPEERREAAIAQALTGVMFSSAQVAVALALLPRYPYAAIARHVLENVDYVRKPREAIAEIRAVATKHPGIAAALAEHQGALAGIPVLKVTARSRITLKGLDPIGRKQLVEANACYGGKRVKVEELFTDGDVDEQIMPSLTERLRIDANGEHAYDGWLYMGDSGTFFRAGTTKVVAEMVQGGIETADKKLKLALQDALASSKRTPRADEKPKKRAPKTKTPAARKPPATKSAPKKAKKKKR